MMRRWFVIGKHSRGLLTFRLRSIHQHDGGTVYEGLPGGSEPEELLYFQELTPEEASLEGRVQEGSTCCIIYPDDGFFTLACVYQHLPLAGYPRLYQASLDDLPPLVRDKCFYHAGVLYFPEYDKVPVTPAYAFLVAGSPPGQVPKEVIDSLNVAFGIKKPGG